MGVMKIVEIVINKDRNGKDSTENNKIYLLKILIMMQKCFKS